MDYVKYLLFSMICDCFCYVKSYGLSQLTERNTYSYTTSVPIDYFRNAK
jgi:hypothetical protein